MKHRRLLLAAATVLLPVIGTAIADEIRMGRSAYGDWRSDAPGLIRKIRAQDVEPPFATLPVQNRSSVERRPAESKLQTMPGFSVAPLATGLSGARVIRVAPNGDIFVSQSRAGKITVIRMGKGDEKTVATYAEGLRNAYGIAFYPPGPNPAWVHVAMEDRVLRFPYKSGDLRAGGDAQTVISDLKTGGHWTRDIAFSPDGKILYVAVGSASNVAADMAPGPDVARWEKERGHGATWGYEEWRANVLSYTPDGRNRQVFATGLRNCSGMAVQAATGTLFCATNERDLLGDNTPPDYVTSVRRGGFYGWPWYYIGDNEDSRAGGGARPDLKGKAIVPDVLVQPHSAPLGLAFNDGPMFPAEWRGDAFVALHGSWNRSQRTGYKIVRMPAKGGRLTGEYQDFVIGFVSGNDRVWGRPVGVAFASDGSLLFSDDADGVIYRVTYGR